MWPQHYSILLYHLEWYSVRSLPKTKCILWFSKRVHCLLISHRSWRFLNLYNHLDFYCWQFAHYFIQDIAQVRTFSFSPGLHIGNLCNIFLDDIKHLLFILTSLQIPSNVSREIIQIFIIIIFSEGRLSTLTYHRDDFQFYKVQSKFPKFPYLNETPYTLPVFSCIFSIIFELKLLLYLLKNNMLQGLIVFICIKNMICFWFYSAFLWYQNIEK